MYAQDELLASERLNLTFGLRVDFPMYYTDPIDNPYSRGLTALDADDNPETVDQSDLPGTEPLFSPRVGFNWNASGDRNTQVRGGTGIFTGRVPFVWIGNVISNPGANPNLFPVGPVRETGDSSTLAQSFDLNRMVTDFKWPQTWVSDLAIDQQLGRGFLGTLEVIYGNDINNVIVRNADLVAPVRTMPDGRPYFGGAGANELNPDGGAGIYVLDNTSEGYNFNVTAQLRKAFEFGLSATVAYSYTQAKNNLKSTEIASVLWQSQPVQGDPNRPELAYSEFGQRHRIIGSATYVKPWSPRFRTSIGLFVEVAEGNRFAGAGGNRYSFIYSGDVNGDGTGGNDLIYIPRDQSEITLADCPSGCGSNVTAATAVGRAQRLHRAGPLPQPAPRRDRRAARGGQPVVQQRGPADHAGHRVRRGDAAQLPGQLRHPQPGQPDQLGLGGAQGGQLRRHLAAPAGDGRGRGAAVRRQRRAGAPVHRAGPDLHRRSQHQFAVEGAARVEVLLRVVASPLSP